MRECCFRGKEKTKAKTREREREKKERQRNNHTRKGEIGRQTKRKERKRKRIQDPEREKTDHGADIVGEARGEDVDPDMLIGLERVGRAEKHDGTEQVPLQLQPGIRAAVDREADERVDRGHNDGSEDEPSHRLAEPFIDRVDHAAESQHGGHAISSDGAVALDRHAVLSRQELASGKSDRQRCSIIL